MLIELKIHFGWARPGNIKYLIRKYPILGSQSWWVFKGRVGTCVWIEKDNNKRSQIRWEGQFVPRVAFFHHDNNKIKKSLDIFYKLSLFTLGYPTSPIFCISCHNFAFNSILSTTILTKFMTRQCSPPPLKNN